MDNSGYAVEIENREYVDPNVSLGEGQQFIENLRQVQAGNNQQIKQDTYNLGTPTTANLGGLTGAEATWNARYQTPQMNQLVSNLDTNMRQTALNTAMQNVLDVYKQRANEAQRNYQKSQHRYSTRGSRSGYGGSGGSGGGTTGGSDGDVPVPEGNTNIDYSNEQQIYTVEEMPAEVKKSLKQISGSTMKNVGLKLWAGYNPSLSDEQNTLNYMAELTRKKNG